MAGTFFPRPFWPSADHENRRRGGDFVAGGVRQACGLAGECVSRISQTDFNVRSARPRPSAARLRPLGASCGVGHETLRDTKLHESPRHSAAARSRPSQRRQATSGKTSSSCSGILSGGLRGLPVMFLMRSSPISERRFASRGCVFRLVSVQLSRMALTTSLNPDDMRR